MEGDGATWRNPDTGIVWARSEPQKTAESGGEPSAPHRDSKGRDKHATKGLLVVLVFLIFLKRQQWLSLPLSLAKSWPWFTIPTPLEHINFEHG